MNRKRSLIASLVFIALGFLGRLYGDQYSYVSADGMLHDSIWLPIGTLMMVFGIIALLIVGIIYAVAAIKKS